MLSAYINYPNSHITLHGDEKCSQIQQQRKGNQRVIEVNTSTLGVELDRFNVSEYRFGSDANCNDMWLRICFDDAEFEKAVVMHIQRIFGNRYQPLATARIIIHC